jgi:hypothetical protein
MDTRYAEAIKEIYNKLKNSDINWAFFGSANLLMQGLNVSPGDVDILTDVRGAYKIENIFIENVARPVKFSSDGRVQSHYGDLKINGVLVQIVGDFTSSEDLKPIANLSEKIFVKFLDMELPCLSLEGELFSYRRHNRLEKVNIIEKYLKK